MPQIITTKEELELAKNSQPHGCILMITSETCPPCKLFKPHYAELEMAFPHIKFCEMLPNCSAFKEEHSESSITAFPTFRRYIKGKLIGEQQIGAIKTKIISMLSN